MGQNQHCLLCFKQVRQEGKTRCRGVCLNPHSPDSKSKSRPTKGRRGRLPRIDAGCIYIYIYIRRPRQTQGGARQGIIHLTLFLNGRSRSSRTKKELKSSFSMGFRSYIRHFWGAIFSKLFRLSLPWGFAAGSGSLLAVAASHQQQQPQQQQQSKVDWIGLDF